MKVSKILLSKQPNTDIVIYLFDSIKTKHTDFETMAYIKTPYYHSFGKISQKQFELLNQDFNFQYGEFVGDIPSIEQLTAHKLKIHKTYKEAKKEKYRLNLAFVYSFYWPDTRKKELTDREQGRYLNFIIEDNLARYDKEYGSATEEEKKTFLSKNQFIKQLHDAQYNQFDLLSIKNTLEALQAYPVLELAYNDYNESIFKQQREFSHRSIHHFVFVEGNFDKRYFHCRSIKELCETILNQYSQTLKAGFKKEMTNYITENLINHSREKEDNTSCIYTLNQNLLNRIIFISEYLDFSKYSWTQIQILLERFNDKEYYFNETLFFPCTNFKGESETENYNAFRKHLSFLQEKNFDLYFVFKYWNLYTTTMRNFASLLDEAKFINLNNKNYKDLNKTYNYLGKRLAENIENFEFKNYNGENFNNNILELDTIKIQEYTLHVVKDFKELMNYGMILDSCAGSKATLDYNKIRITYVLAKDGQIKFMGCIKDGQFNQLKGYKNSSPSLELFVDTFKTLQNLNFVDKIEKQHLKDKYKTQYQGDLWRSLYEQECVQH